LKNTKSIKNWADDDKPREKLLTKGVSALSNAELVAILIGSGTKDLSAVDLAKEILNNAENNINILGKKNVKELTKHKGIGEAKAITIVAALELGRRRKADENKITKITSSNDVYTLFFPLLSDLQHEEFWILTLNRSNKVINKHRISQGGLSATIIDNKLIFNFILADLASSLILCHNHPSGNIQPSENDKQITNKIKQASKLFDITLLDHIIITQTKYFRFADANIL